MSEYKVNGSEGAREGGLGHDVLKKNRNFYIGVGGTVLEGLLSGSLFMLINRLSAKGTDEVMKPFLG